MATQVNANGHRRRQLRQRVLAEEHYCALCGDPVNKGLGFIPGRHGDRCRGNCPGCVPDPRRPEVDEDLPVSRGGSPLDRRNVALMHRECNRWKGQQTLAEARAAFAVRGDSPQSPVVPSPGW